MNTVPGAASMGLTVEKLSRLCGRWLSSFDWAFGCFDTDPAFLQEGSIEYAAVELYLQSVLSFVAAVLEKGAPLKGIELDLALIPLPRYIDYNDEIGAIMERGCAKVCPKKIETGWDFLAQRIFCSTVDHE